MRRIDVVAPVKYDMKLHGARFIVVEFGLATIGGLAFALLELTRGSRSAAVLLSGLWLLGFALNCLAVMLLAAAIAWRGLGLEQDERRMRLYALELILLLLAPFVLVALIAWQWRSGDVGI